MALLASQAATSTGTAPSYQAAAAGGDTLQPGDDVMLHVKTGATGTTVTVASPTPCSQGATHNLSITVPANAERMIGPFPAQRFANNATGLVNVTYSSVTTVTVAAVRV